MDHEIVVYIHKGGITQPQGIMNDMGFEGKWMQLEVIMLSEVSQDQKHKRCMFSLIH
jgi:hypothetical protein